MSKGRQRGTRQTPRQLRLSSLVASLRKARGLSQAELGERAGLAVDTIGRLERGTFSPSLDTLYKLAEGLDLSLGTFIAQLEFGERDRAVEIAELARQLEPEELDMALRVLTVLAELVRETGEESEDE